MKISDILLLYDYNHWANQRILDTAVQVSQEQFVAPTGHSFGSLRGTLVHLLDTEWGWRMLCQHHASTPLLEEEAFPTLSDLAQRWHEEDRLHDRFRFRMVNRDWVIERLSP
jgi:uncharacterized damage-inducible protein DinB